MTSAVLLLALLLQEAPPPAGPRAEPVLRIEFTEEVRKEPAEGLKGRDGKPVAPSKETTAVSVWLASRSFTVVRENGTEHYDMEAGRVRSWTEGAETSRSDALVAFVDARRLEFFNRCGIADLLRTMEKEDPAFDLLNLESLFGMEKEAGALRGRIARKEAEGVVTFSAGEEVVVRMVRGDGSLPPGTGESWVRFLRHETRLHPAVLDSLAAETHLPAELSWTWRNPGTAVTTTLRLVKAEEVAGWVPAVPKEGIPGDDPLDAALTASLSAKPPTREAALAVSAAFREKGAFVEAFLVLIARGLAPGDGMGEEVRALRSVEGAQEALVPLFRLIGNPDTPEGAAAQAAELLAFKEKAPKDRFLLDIFRANNLDGAEKGEEARAVMRGVLEKHPEIAGAWVDLGGMYHRGFQAVQAWRCWEAGLRVAPDHPMLEGVKGLRGHLREEYPEFFR